MRSSSTIAPQNVPNVLDLRVRTQCRTCAKKCCSQPYDWVHLTSREAGVLSTASGLPVSEFTELHRNEATGGVFQLLNLPCRFYSETDGTCSVYEARPLVCRLFPFYPEPLTGRIELIVAQCGSNLEFLSPVAREGWTATEYVAIIADWVRTIWRESTLRKSLSSGS